MPSPPALADGAVAGNAQEAAMTEAGEQAPPPPDAAAGELFWQRSSPFAALFFLGRITKGLVGNLQSLAGTSVMLVALAQKSMVYAVLAAVGVLAASVAAALLRYWHFRFHLNERGVRIRQGVFKKVEVDVQFDRIQGIHVEQSLIYRWLGLVTVSFDTAGSAAQEGHLPAVTRQFADALRQRVDGQQQPVADAEAQRPESGSARGLPLARRPRTLLALGNRDMLRIALTDPSVLVGLAFLGVLGQYYDGATQDLAKQAVQQATAEIAASPSAVLAVAIAGLLLSVLVVFLLLALASAFLRFHDFRLFQEGTAFRSQSGLLTRKEVVVERDKIQQLNLAQGLPMRLLKRYRLRALPARSGGAGAQGGAVAATQALHVPLLPGDAVEVLRTEMFGDEGQRLQTLPTGSFAGISPHYIRARVLVFGVAPALVATTIATAVAGVVGLLCLAWVVPTALVAWQSWRRWGYRVDDDGLACRSGLLGYRVHAFLFRKMQAVAVSRSPMQRRTGLATLHVQLACGPLTLPFIDHATACRLRDYMLYKAESSRLPWH